MKERVEKFRRVLEKNNLKGIFLTSYENKYYVGGLRDESDDTYVLLTKYNVYLFVDARYYERAIKETEDVKVVLFTRNFYEKIKEVLELEEIKEIGFEDKNMRVFLYNNLLKNVGVKLTPVDLTNVRAVKDAIELFYLRKAVSIVDSTFKQIKKYVKPGLKEIEIKDFVESTMKKLGAECPSFDTIVVSGKNGSMPHGIATNKRVTAGDFITIDFGAKYKGYCSDITRTIVLDKVKNKQMKEIYDVVLNANLAAIKAVKPGIKIGEVDKAARDYITSKGYGEYFTHSTGHGIGLLIHDELGVYLTSEVIIEENMVFTIEPGIYVPGLGGVRIEDDILVTKNGCEILTKSSKKLTIIK
ncbi:MAG: aminopeptidase P family protein [Erysipelotrichaceae bacterium]|nr:aminopeptidase P family protein [Erysipelotrichaceae bacterium]